jgi:hypothetical protein
VLSLDYLINCIRSYPHAIFFISFFVYGCAIISLNDNLDQLIRYMDCLHLFAFNSCIRKDSSGASQALTPENQFSVAVDFIAPVAFVYSWVGNVDTRAFHSAIVRPVYTSGTRRTGESVADNEKRR